MNQEVVKDLRQISRYPMIEADLKSLVVRPIRRGEEVLWDRLMSEYHYLGFRQLVGESLKYVAVLEGQWVALLGWCTAAFKCKPRDEWIGWSPQQQWQRLKYVVNNQRFLILPWVRIKNLASRVLALNLKRLSLDWEAIYGHPVVLAETFVDQSRFSGTCYRACGWIALGQTRGYGRNAGRYFFHGQPKTVWVRPLRRGVPKLLSDPFLAPELLGEGAMIDLNRVELKGEGGLIEVLRRIKDPRKRRGIRHQQVTILALAILAMLSGARSFLAIAEWAKSQTQDILRLLGCRKDPRTGRYLPPSEPTIRRTLQAVNAEEVDRVLGDWLAGQCKGKVIAFDGKTLRGTRDREGKALHLLSALVYEEGVVISQCEVEEKSNEITAARPLLEPLDLKGKIIVADALHTQGELARYLKEQKGADYVFFVKGNQENLLKDIQDLKEEDFSP